MDREQKVAGLTMCGVGLIFGTLGWFLGVHESTERIVVISAILGGCSVLLIFALFWRESFANAGYFGVNPPRTSTSRRTTRIVRSEWAGRVARVLAIGGFLVAWAVLGLSTLSFLGCVASFGAGMCFVAAVLHYGLLAAAELKWRIRERA